MHTTFAQIKCSFYFSSPIIDVLVHIVHMLTFSHRSCPTLCFGAGSSSSQASDCMYVCMYVCR